MKPILLSIIVFFIVFIVSNYIIGAIRAICITPEARANFIQKCKDQIAAKKANKRAKKIYQKRYDYWYDKSYDVIDGYAIQSASKRDAYARRHALQDLKKYHWE